MSKKEAYYFSHDSNARNDPKILSMRSVYGSEGYGWYWIIIETLREQKDYKIEITKYVWNALAMQMQCDADASQKFVEDCINEFNLFASDGEYFWSESLLRRMNDKDEKSELAKKAAEARWRKRNKDKGSSESDNSKDDSNADAMQTHSECIAIKEKKRKEKKRKEKESTDDKIVGGGPAGYLWEINQVERISQLDIDQCKEAYFKSNAYTSAKETLAMNYRLSLEDLNYAAVAFNNSLAQVGVSKKSPDGWARHFRNWLSKNWERAVGDGKKIAAGHSLTEQRKRDESKTELSAEKIRRIKAIRADIESRLRAGEGSTQ